MPCIAPRGLERDVLQEARGFAQRFDALFRTDPPDKAHVVTEPVGRLDSFRLRQIRHDLDALGEAFSH